MRKSETYLRTDQIRFLQELCFVESRKQGKRVSMAQMIRDAVDSLMQKRAKIIHRETRMILSNAQFLKDIDQAQEDLKHKRYSTHTKEVFGR